MSLITPDEVTAVLAAIDEAGDERAKRGLATPPAWQALADRLRIDRELGPIWLTGVSGTTDHEIRESLRTKNVQSWLEHEAVKLGTEAQQAAYTRAALPEVEILEIVRRELFAGFDILKRWEPLRWQDAKHAIGCTRGRVTFETKPWPVGVTTTNGMLQRIEAAAAALEAHPWLSPLGIKPTVAPAEHVATCAVCATTTRGDSALVSIPWAGRRLSREYALAWVPFPPPVPVD